MDEGRPADNLDVTLVCQGVDHPPRKTSLRSHEYFRKLEWVGFIESTDITLFWNPDQIIPRLDI